SEAEAIVAPSAHIALRRRGRWMLERLRAACRAVCATAPYRRNITARKRSALIRDRRSCQPNAPAPRVPAHLRYLRRSPQAGASSIADREDTDWHPPARSERALQPRRRISASQRAQQRWCYDFADPESPSPAVEARKEADWQARNPPPVYVVMPATALWLATRLRERG